MPTTGWVTPGQQTRVPLVLLDDEARNASQQATTWQIIRAALLVCSPASPLTRFPGPKKRVPTSAHLLQMEWTPLAGAGCRGVLARL